MRTTIPGALVIRGDHSWQAPCREKCKATPILQFKTCLSTASRSQRRMKKSTICPISSVALHDIHPPTFLEQRTSSQILWRWVPSLHLGLSFACARWAAYSIAGPRSRPRKATWQAQALVASRHRHHSRAGGYLPGSARPGSADLKRVCSETRPAAVSCSSPSQNTAWWLLQSRAELLKQKEVPADLAPSYLSYNFLTDGSTNQLLSAVYSTVSKLTG